MGWGGGTEGLRETGMVKGNVGAVFGLRGIWGGGTFRRWGLRWTRVALVFPSAIRHELMPYGSFAVVITEDRTWY